MDHLFTMFLRVSWIPWDHTRRYYQHRSNSQFIAQQGVASDGGGLWQRLDFHGEQQARQAWRGGDPSGGASTTSSAGHKNGATALGCHVA